MRSILQRGSINRWKCHCNVDAVCPLLVQGEAQHRATVFCRDNNKSAQAPCDLHGYGVFIVLTVFMGMFNSAKGLARQVPFVQTKKVEAHNFHALLRKSQVLWQKRIPLFSITNRAFGLCDPAFLRRRFSRFPIASSRSPSREKGRQAARYLA